MLDLAKMSVSRRDTVLAPLALGVMSLAAEAQPLPRLTLKQGLRELDASSGRPSMVRFIVLWNKPKDVDAFERHYREVHIPLAKKMAGVRRYTLSRNTSPVRGGEPYYRIAELDWDDMASLQLAFRSPEGRATADDIARLSELSPGVKSMIYELEDV
jgi:uncharacterized protein (TIGR02118 family)